MSVETTIKWIGDDWERIDRLKQMLYAVLYVGFGVPEDGDWYHVEPSETAVAMAGSRIVGSVRLLGLPGESSRQLRQLAVEPALRRQGIGRALVVAAERRAADEGTREIWLNARDAAYPFYASLGYGFMGEEFVSELTGIPHRHMSRQIGKEGA